MHTYISMMMAIPAYPEHGLIFLIHIYLFSPVPVWRVGPAWVASLWEEVKGLEVAQLVRIRVDEMMAKVRQMTVSTFILLFLVRGMVPRKE